MTNHHTTFKKGEKKNPSTGAFSPKFNGHHIATDISLLHGKMTAQHFRGDNAQFLTWWQFITVIDTNYTA